MIQASISGPKDSLGTQLGITAGPLTASASGTVDLQHEAADLAVEDPALAAYNARLAELAAKGPKTWRAREKVVVRREQ